MVAARLSQKGALKKIYRSISCKRKENKSNNSLGGNEALLSIIGGLKLTSVNFSLEFDDITYEVHYI